MSELMFSIQTAANQFLSNLSALEQRLNKSNQQVSSGLRVQTVSDDPAVVSQIVQLNAHIAANNQVKTNLSQVQTEVNAAEQAINTATTLMDRAAQIATQGSSSTATVDRGQLAQQVSDIATEMQQLADTQVAGRYVFSGDSDQTPAYKPVDFTTNPVNGVGAYQGSASTRTVVDSYGGKISISATAQDIFDGGGATPGNTNSVFQTLASLYAALMANNPTATAQAAANLVTASNYLNGQQAQYGDIQNKLSDALTAQASLDTNLRAQLSTAQDADEAQAVIQQQTDNTALTAAETAYSSFPKKSLFDYLA
jgi:flagellar hook-associated protein 3 FlgL